MRLRDRLKYAEAMERDLRELHKSYPVDPSLITVPYIMRLKFISVKQTMEWLGYWEQLRKLKKRSRRSE